MKRLALVPRIVRLSFVGILVVLGASNLNPRFFSWLAPVPARAEEIPPESVRVSNMPLDRVEQAIQQKGLHWEATTYDREFTLGLERPTATAALEAPPASLEAAALPAALDWRNHNGNYVSPPKEQGYCGSCWAFMSVGTLESQYAITNHQPGNFLDLSEQTLVSCASSSCGCNGCNPETGAGFLVTSGAPLESCFPYVASKVPCANACTGWQASAYKISGFSRVSYSLTSLKEALQTGPLATDFNVFADFMSYQSGVYEHATGELRGGHGVVIVGYVDTSGQYGGGYFIVKNSWGTHWGEQGFFRIGYSQTDCASWETSTCFGHYSYHYTVTATQPSTVTLKFKLEGVSSSITRADGVQVKIGSFSTTVSASLTGGQFVGTVSPQLPSGSYTLRVKGPRYLSRTLPVTLTSSGGTVTADFVTAQKPFLAGDLDPNHDNRIDISDVGVLVRNYGLTTSAALAAADLNSDGRVNMFDAGYLLKNYGLSGEE